MNHRLFVPNPRWMTQGPVPLLVALHGCTQTAADFAAGSRFDIVADRLGAFVLYPEQTLRANPRRCWSWYLRKNQVRATGEPAAILELVEQTCQRYPIDRARVYVAGPSAGGIMSAILAEQAPDIFAAAGIAASIPLHAGVDIPSGLRAMKAKVPEEVITGISELAPFPREAYQQQRVTIWTGVEDKLVDPRNSTMVARQFCRLYGVDATQMTVESRIGAEVTRWRDPDGTVRVELWRIESMGHLWSGGSFRGSHTYPPGPPQSDEMMAFFLAGALQRAELEAPPR
ncbi:MAG: alpha/beta hydrolase family esterase [Vulcanimicrobiaceae bacterium]